MPKINVYLSDELAEAVRQHNLPISSICQKALEQAVRKIGSAAAKPDPGVFGRFSGEARESIMRAEQQADSLGHNHIGTEHLLLGLTADPEKAVARALSSLGLTHQLAVERVLTFVPRGVDPPKGRPAFTPRAKRMLESALRIATRDVSPRVEEEHLALALLSDEDGIACKVLTDAGISTERLRREISTRLRVADEQAGVDETELGLMPLLEMRMNALREELTEEFARLRERFDQERAQTEALRDLLAQKGANVESAPAPEGKQKKRDALKCSFCSKVQGDVEKLIAGPGVYICDECIALCNEIIAEEMGPPDPSV